MTGNMQGTGVPGIGDCWSIKTWQHSLEEENFQVKEKHIIQTLSQSSEHESLMFKVTERSLNQGSPFYHSDHKYEGFILISLEHAKLSLKKHNIFLSKIFICLRCAITIKVTNVFSSHQAAY